MQDDEFDLFDEQNGDAMAEQEWKLFRDIPGVELEIQLDAAKIWGSSWNLANFLAKRPHLIGGANVVELGAGLGLPAIVSAKLGAKHVWGTDADSHAVEALERVIERNSLSQNAKALKLDWRNDEQRRSLSSVPIVFAADVNYETKSVRPLLYTVDDLLAPGGTLYLASREDRFGLTEFLSHLQRASFVREELELDYRVREEISPQGSCSVLTEEAERKIGLGLVLTRVVYFGADGAEYDGPPSDVDSPHHKLWIFSRPKLYHEK